MARVAINGKDLHEVEMLLLEYAEGTISYMKYPEHRITAEMKEDTLTVELPAMLALELYRSDILPQDEEKSFSVDLDGERVGSFQVFDLRYPLDSGSDTITVTLERADHVTD